MTRKTIQLIATCLTAGLILLFVGANIVFAKDTVNVGIQYDPATLNALGIKTELDIFLISHINENLIGFNLETGISEITKNALAESIRVVKNGKGIKFRIKKDIRFHTGDLLTAHDVKFTYEQCLNPENGNIMAGYLDEIEEIEILDNHNFIFHLYEPSASWRNLGIIGICSKKYYEKVGGEEFRSQPVGSGPFRYISRKRGESVTLEAVEDHRMGPEFKTLNFKVVPDEIKRIEMLESGELDLISHIQPSNVERLKKKAHIKVKSAIVPSLHALSLKQDTYPIMRDNKLGQAIMMGINRQELVDNIFLGEGYPLYMYTNKIELGYDPKYSVEFNPSKARELVNQSSYKPDTPLILTYHSGFPNAKQVVSAIQKYLQDIGITVKTYEFDTKVFYTYARTKDKRLGHLAVYGMGGGRDPNLRLLVTLPSDGPYNSYSERPRQKEMDALVYAQGKEMNQKKRLLILKKLHRILQSDYTYIPLFGLNVIYAMNDSVDYEWLQGVSNFSQLNSIKILK
ncbi:MAG: ABC transporter substrate-binding protein [Deltaproteobacteria bacterium]|nr:ABC transporter substrate-binding protein [Deltaproteobacteria bacterium]